MDLSTAAISLKDINKEPISIIAAIKSVTSLDGYELKNWVSYAFQISEARTVLGQFRRWKQEALDTVLRPIPANDKVLLKVLNCEIQASSSRCREKVV
jgi:hypothetical protein